MFDGFEFDEFETGDELAKARWADPNYIADKYRYDLGKLWLGRNPHDFDQMIGVPLEKHVFVCAETGAGKGRSFIINNLLLWPGSTVVYDPKGEIPSIVAPARGSGGPECPKGLGQKQFVLDPLGHAHGIDPEHRSFFDPLWGLDPDDDDLRSWISRIAHSLVKKPKDAGNAEWTGRAVRLISVIIEYVVSSRFYEPHQRTILEVLRLVRVGRKEEINLAIERDVQVGKIAADPENGISLAEAKAKRRAEYGHPHLALLREIEDEAEGYLSEEASSLLETAQTTKKFFENVRSESTDRLRWLTGSKKYQESLTGYRDGERIFEEHQRFDPRELKTNPDGVSVYIVMPSDDMEENAPWVQMVITSIMAAMRRTPYPKGGRPKYATLGIIDEFSSLGEQEYIANSMDNIRGAGMHLMIVVQNMGGLARTYAEARESFINNAGVKIFFGDVGETAKDYIVKELGETEIVKYQIARSASSSHSSATQETRTHQHSRTRQEGGSDGFTDTTSNSQGGTYQTTTAHGKTRTKSFNMSEGVNWSNGKYWGKGNGRTTGKNYGPTPFFQIFADSNNYGTSLNRNSGHNINKGGSRQESRGAQTSESKNESESLGRNWQEQQSRAINHTRNYSNSETIGESHAKGWTETDTETLGITVTQQNHKKPLLEFQEIRQFFGVDAADEFDAPAYPGFMLVLIGREPPTFVRRCNYDQDPFFEGLFAPHPVHGYLPLEKMPLLGHEVTLDHIIQLELPPVLAEEGYKAELVPRRHSLVKRDDPIVDLTEPDGTKHTIKALGMCRILHTQGETVESFGTVRCLFRDNYSEKAEMASFPLFEVYETFDKFESAAKKAREAAEEKERARQEAERIRRQRAKEEEEQRKRDEREAQIHAARVNKEFQRSQERNYQISYLVTLSCVVGYHLLFFIAPAAFGLVEYDYGGWGLFFRKAFTIAWNLAIVWGIQIIVLRAISPLTRLASVSAQWRIASHSMEAEVGDDKVEGFIGIAGFLMFLSVVGCFAYGGNWF